MRKCIFTVNTGGYDSVHSVPRFRDWDKVCFTDSDIDTKNWDVVKIKTSDPLLTSRDIKIRSHHYLSEYDLVCYIDANQKFVSKPESVPMWFRHPTRDCIFKEGAQIIKLNKADKNTVLRQLHGYKKQGYNYKGLFMNGFFIRKHQEDINFLHDVWFDELKKGCYRDQLSLPFAIWKTGIEPDNIKDSRLKYRFASITTPHLK